MTPERMSEINTPPRPSEIKKWELEGKWRITKEFDFKPTTVRDNFTYGKEGVHTAQFADLSDDDVEQVPSDAATFNPPGCARWSAEWEQTMLRFNEWIDNMEKERDEVPSTCKGCRYCEKRGSTYHKYFEYLCWVEPGEPVTRVYYRGDTINMEYPPACKEWTKA